MILLVHMLFGVAMGSLTKNWLLAVLLAFFSHYFIDLLPHVEYDIEEIKNLPAQASKDWRRARPAFLRVMLDFSIGLLLISIFTNKSFIIFVCAFFAILPDGLSILNEILPNKFLNFHDIFHLEKIHFLKHNKKFSNFWRILTQVLIIIISILILN